MRETSLRKIVVNIFLHPLLEKKKHLCVLIFSLLLLAASQSLFLLLLGPFLKTMFSLHHESGLISGSAFLSPRLQSVFPSLSQLSFEKRTLVIGVPGLLLFAGFLKNIATYLYQIHSSYFGLLVAKHFRDRLFTAILNQPYRDIALRSPAEWMSVLMNDVLFLQNKFSDIANGLVRDSFMTLAAFLTLFFIHWPTALGFMILTPFIAWGVGRTGKKIAKYTETFQKKLAELADLVLEFRKRFESIKAHRAETYEQRRFFQVNKDYYDAIRKSIFVRSIFAPVLEFLSYAIFAGILLFLAHGGASTHFSPTDMVVFLAALGAMMRPLRQIGEQLTQFHETQGALSKSLSLLLNLKEDEKKSSHLALTPNTAIQINSIHTGFLKAHVEAKSLQIKPAQSIAIIGPSGGGKSTLVRTLCGLLDPQEWTGNIEHEAFADKTSFVSQMPFLFDETILNNLNYGLASPCNEKELEACLNLVGMRDEVHQFKDGLQTHIRAIQSNISGGQKQRLVLVRALLRHKSILVLDEATSSVDPHREEMIVDKILQWARDHHITVLSVTHRLGMLPKYDEVWFVENGNLSAKGRFEVLMQEPRFQNFYNASL